MLVHFFLAVIACDITSCAPVPESKHDPGSQTNGKYPLTDPVPMPDGSVQYRIAIISDLDEKSVSPDQPDTWMSFFHEGHLTYDASKKTAVVAWDDACKKFTSHVSADGRGMELSESVTYDGRLLTVDDKTGYVFDVVVDENAVKPWVKLAEGDGTQTKGMKCEWATVKDSKLYVGTQGQELICPGGRTVMSYKNMWVKSVDRDGAVEHLNWTENYVKLRSFAGIEFPGYMVHESCAWSEVHRRWYFLPRKASTEPYDPKADEEKGTNLLLAATEDFADVKVVKVGQIIPKRGYSSFKFIPGTQDTVIVAIDTLENGDTTATFVSVFTIDGEIVYPQTKVSDLKFEGIEFI